VHQLLDRVVRLDGEHIAELAHLQMETIVIHLWVLRADTLGSPRENIQGLPQQTAATTRAREEVRRHAAADIRQQRSHPSTLSHALTT
jgi:hypothetical protein